MSKVKRMIPFQPDVYTAGELKDWSVLKSEKGGEWKPARPEGHNIKSILWRWKVAWKVLTGQYDALKWD